MTSERRGLSSISDSLAAMFLRDAIKKGCGMEIPSLGIKIEGAIKMKRFSLQRLEDETGVSGVGVVAEGIQFTSGICVLSWLTEVRSIAAIYDSIDDLEQLHGHNGLTIIEWID